MSKASVGAEEMTIRYVPVHQEDPARLGQVERHSSGLQRDQKDGHIRRGGEPIDRRLSRCSRARQRDERVSCRVIRRRIKRRRTFHRHPTLEPAHLESCPLEPIGNDVEERDELREDERLGRHVLRAQLRQLLDESLDFGRRFKVLASISDVLVSNRADRTRREARQTLTERSSRPSMPCFAF